MSAPNLPKRDLYLTHREYAGMLAKWSELSQIRPDGTVDTGRFNAWAMRHFHLAPFYQYTIILEGNLQRRSDESSERNPCGRGK